MIKYFNEPKGFHEYESDSRILYETGAEANARIVADSLNIIMKCIEKKQYFPFINKVKIYIFSDLKNYERHSPSKGSAGSTFGSRYIILSPKKANTTKRLPRVLAHELSHFQMSGYTSIFKLLLLPTWFKEGLAVWASEGTGAENVTESEAQLAILENKQINPVYHEAIFWGKRSHPKDMSTHMFYRQSGMFIEYLYQIDSTRFKKLFYMLYEKNEFEKSVILAYDKPIELLWEDFIQSLR
jgi:hypothetical protein